MAIVEHIKSNLQSRPHWMNAILLFCGYMTFIYLPWDIFIKPLAVDQEVWLGLMFTGWAAKIGGVLHWLVYGALFYGLLRMKKWVHPWAAIYAMQIAVSGLIWSALNHGGAGWLSGAVAFTLFAVLALQLWIDRSLFAN